MIAIRAAKTALAEAERRWVKAQNNQPLRTSRKTAAVARQTLDLHGQPDRLTADDRKVQSTASHKVGSPAKETARYGLDLRSTRQHDARSSSFLPWSTMHTLCQP